jgi:hypothetical protein
MLDIQAHAGTNPMAKALDAAELVLSNNRFAPQNSASVLRALYAVVNVCDVYFGSRENDAGSAPSKRVVR